MDKLILLQHFILIDMKKSSLSREERRLVINRVEFGVNKGSIGPEDLIRAKDLMNQFMVR